MGIYKAPAPCDLWSEHLRLNPASFATVATASSDDWLKSAQYPMTPAQNMAGETRTVDGVAYATQPIEQSWYERFNGTLSPAKATNSSTGSTRMGQST